MRRTPPVVVQLQPQPAAQAAVVLIAVLAVAGVLAWALSHHPQVWPATLAIPVIACVAWRAAAVAPRRLRWDGEAWWLAAPAGDEEQTVRLRVLIDLDRWLLLQARPGPYWLPLSCHQQPSWGALRATLFAAPAAAVR